MDGTTTEEGAPPQLSSDRNRKRALLYTLPFLAIGLGDVGLLLFWGLEPLWGFVVLLPILFCTILTYTVFSTDFLDDRS